jgi:hypothetical protein
MKHAFIQGSYCEIAYKIFRPYFPLFVLQFKCLNYKNITYPSLGLSKELALHFPFKYNDFGGVISILTVTLSMLKVKVR